MTETLTAPAASAPAPASSPAPAPVAAPAPAAAPAPVAPAAAAPAAPLIDKGGVTSNVDPAKYPIKEDYAAALLKEKLGAIPAVTDEPAAVTEPEVVLEPAATPETQPEVPAPDAEVKPEAVTEPELDLNPPAIVTPEALTQMMTDNPEFGKLIEADPKLKGQLYKTAREAAELKPYKEILPDIDSAKEAVASQRAHNDILRTFMSSTTREGTQQTLAKMMELSYERDEDGNVVQENGQPVVGQDFYGFVDNVVALDLEHRRDDVKARLQANQYHLNPQYKSQEEVDAAYKRDQDKLAFFEEELNEEGPQAAAVDMPEPIRRQKEELDRRERELNEKQHGGKVQERVTYEKSVVDGSRERLNGFATAMIASAKKQGVAISPYLEKALQASITQDLFERLQSDEGLKGRLEALQLLPATEKTKGRRFAEWDRSIQSYGPDIGLKHFEAAGVQMVATAKQKADKVAAQAQTTKQTEIQGSRGASAGGAATMTAKAADVQAQAEWQKANPGKPFDRIAQAAILPRVLQLMGASV